MKYTAVDLKTYMKLMGIEWEFIKKEKHYLIRYSYRGKKGKYLPRINKPLEEVEDLLLAMVYIPLSNKEKFEKYFPIEITDLGRVMTKYYEHKPYASVKYVIERFRMLNKIKTYYMSSRLHKDKFIEWVDKCGFVFFTEKYSKFLFYIID